MSHDVDGAVWEWFGIVRRFLAIVLVCLAVYGLPMHHSHRADYAHLEPIASVAP